MPTLTPVTGNTSHTSNSGRAPVDLETALPSPPIALGLGGAAVDSGENGMSGGGGSNGALTPLPVAPSVDRSGTGNASVGSTSSDSNAVNEDGGDGDDVVAQVSTARSGGDGVTSAAAHLSLIHI